MQENLIKTMVSILKKNLARTDFPPVPVISGLHTHYPCVSCTEDQHEACRKCFNLGLSPVETVGVIPCLKERVPVLAIAGRPPAR